MSGRFVNYIFFTSVALICCCISVFSQDKCNLQFSVYEFKETGDSENFPIEDYKIKLVNAKTKKPLKVSKIGGVAIVADVTETQYIATISKDGFQNTEDKFLVDCNLVDSQNTVSEIVFLWKGDSKKTFKMYFDNSFGTTFAVEKQDSDSGNEIINNSAVILAKPEYPRAARAVRATGKVEVRVLINELGYVISAEAISGHPLLQFAAIEAAKKSKFKPTLLSGIPVKVNGIIVYNFVP
jgi:TonB family protein